MDKRYKELQECATFKQLLSVVNKYEKRKMVNYLSLFLPLVILSIVFYVGVILLIVFAIKQYELQLILTFTIIYLLCGYGIYIKYFAYALFKKARLKELKHYEQIHE